MDDGVVDEWVEYFVVLIVWDVVDDYGIVGVVVD